MKSRTPPPMVLRDLIKELKSIKAESLSVCNGRERQDRKGKKGVVYSAS